MPSTSLPGRMPAPGGKSFEQTCSSPGYGKASPAIPLTHYKILRTAWAIDRSFGNESIVEHLNAEGATFYIRLKGGNFVECDGQKTVVKIRGLEEKDASIHLFGLTLRVVRSPKSRRAPEPWYILTNDQESSRTKIVRIYYHRFEIEETFKDTKHLFELHHLKFMRPTSLKVVLWLVFLGIALLYVVTRPPQTRATNPKKFISWIRQAYEQFQRELTSYRGLTGLTPRLSFGDRGIV